MAGWLRRIFGREAAGPAGIGPVWIEVGELRDRLARGKAPLIVDVRGPDEFDGPLGHIDGALNVPLAALPSRIPEIRRAAAPVVLVCLTDKRSSQAASLLADAGMREIAVLRGGMRAWRSE